MDFIVAIYILRDGFFGSFCCKGFFAFSPVAWAKLISLEGVKHSQHFADVAADVEVIYIYPTHYSLGIDDKRGAISYSFPFIQNTELFSEALRCVGYHREAKVFQVLMALAPCEMHMLCVS